MEIEMFHRLGKCKIVPRCCKDTFGDRNRWTVYIWESDIDDDFLSTVYFTLPANISSQQRFLTNLRRSRESRGGGQDALLSLCTLTYTKLREAANYTTNKLSDVSESW